MRQTIRHGAQIDTVTPAELNMAIAEATAAQRQQHVQFHRHKDAVVLDATGAGSMVAKPGRSYDWRLERVSCAAGAAGQVTFYENQQQDSDILEVIQLNAQFRYSDSFSNTLFVPAGSALLVVFAGGGANAQASLNLQIQMIRVDR